VQLEQRDWYACVSVTDQGIGIPRASLARLFQRFYRAENADQRRISGMGIGLYVVKEIVDLHGGTVGVTSTEGEGSTFTVCLPLLE
jgi:signal transduction histidine kinase